MSKGLFSVGQNQRHLSLGQRRFTLFIMYCLKKHETTYPGSECQEYLFINEGKLVLLALPADDRYFHGVGLLYLKRFDLEDHTTMTHHGLFICVLGKEWGFLKLTSVTYSIHKQIFSVCF